MAEGDVELGPVDMIDHTVHQLLLNFDEEVMDRSKHHSWSIYMVPRENRLVSPDSYTPQVVSIGPLHHQDEHLKGYEVQKATYMHNLLHNVLHPWERNSTPEQIIKACVTKVSGSTDKIKECYVGVQPYTDSELVKMMVTDACFILAFIYNSSVCDSSLGENRLLRTSIIRDMVLMENQIPFFVLEDIFECTFSKFRPTFLFAEFLLYVQINCNLFERKFVLDVFNLFSTHDHLLGFLHTCYQNPDHDSSRYRVPIKPHSVVEFDRSGVRFNKKLDAEWPMAMELKHSRFLCFPLSWSKPTLKMPVLRLYDETEAIIRNLIIYEQCAGVQTCVTSYMKVMDMLIDTPEDVAKLVKSQVLNHYLGSDEKVANLINSMLKAVVIRDFYYQD